MAGDLFLTKGLASVMHDLGYSCTVDEKAFRAALRQCPEISNQAIAEVFAMMARTHSSDQQSLQSNGNSKGSHTASWNINVVADVLKTSFPLDWSKVADLLDHQGFHLPDQQSFVLLNNIYRRASGEQIPLKAVISRVWQNVTGQLSFLRFAVSAPAPEIYSFERSDRLLPPVEGLGSGRSPVGTPNYAWLSLDLLEILCYIAEAGNISAVRSILEYPAKHCPEVLLLGMAAVPVEWSLLQREVYGALLPVYLANAANSQVVLHRLWGINQSLLLEALVEYYTQDQAQIARILDICQELKILPKVLESTPYAFALELASLASWRQYLNLEKWLSELIARDNSMFLQAVIRFLDVKTHVQIGLDGAPLSAKVKLQEDCVRIFLKVLQTARTAIPGELAQHVRRVQQQAAKMYPNLASIATQGNEAFASDVEEEANSHFQKIYSEQKPIDEVVQMLKQFKASQAPREQEVFACMVHNLFDEYRFFPRYPDKELHITAVLFGALIYHQLVSSITLGLALQYVLDALKKPPGSKMFTFGVDALRQFVGSAAQWPQFCTFVLQIPHMREAELDMFARLESALRDRQHTSGSAMQPGAAVTGNGVAAEGGESSAFLTGQGMVPGGTSLATSPDRTNGPHAEPARPLGLQQLLGAGAALQQSAPQQQSTSSQPPADVGASMGDGDQEDKEGQMLAAAVAASSLMPAAAKEAPSFSLVNSESLETAAEKYRDFVEPPELVQDRIHFLINNLSKDNVDTRAAEIKSKLWPNFGAWFANYMVVKRAAQEANYHTLYISMCDCMSEKDLLKLLIKTTHYYVRILLYSERTVKESNDRALLKNLGVWLGLLTFSRNKPVLSKELELKGIITEAYQRGRLIAVLPFAQKLLECCKDSKIFKPSNPMIAGILSLLAELHGMKGLKINNIFSIELVFKAFNLSPAEVKPTDVLRNLPRERLQNPDWSVEALPQETPQPAVVQADGKQDQPSQAPSPSTIQQPGQLQAQAQAQAQHNLAMAGRSAASPGDAAKSGSITGAAESPVQQAAGSPAGGMPPGMSPQPAGLDQSILAQLHAYTVINPSLGSVAERLQLKRHVPTAVDRAIFEILSPVVERSVTIACYTTVELLLKDFAMDPDENRMRKAAHLMVSSLAGSLAMVTCKDPLRVSLSNSLRTLLGQGGVDSPTLESVVNVVVTDNLDLGCTVIERAATEKAVRDVDKLLQQAYDDRIKARAQGKPFADSSAFHGRFPSSLPEALRPRPGMVTPYQLRVYEDFARIPRTAPPPTATPVAPAGAVPGMAAAGQPARQLPTPPGIFPATADGNESKQLAEGHLLDKYLLWQGQADAAISAKESQGPGADTSDLQLLLQELQDAVMGSGSAQDDTCSFFARRVFKHLFESPTKLTATFYVACLQNLSEVSTGKRLVGELTALYVQADDERKFNKEICEMLLKARLLSLQEVDLHLAKVLANTRSHAATDLVLHLVKACILREPQVLTYQDMFSSLEVLVKLAQRTPGSEPVMQLLDQARKASASALVPNRPPTEVPAAVRDKSVDPPGLRDQTIACFEDWLRLLTTAGGDEKGLQQWLVTLRNAGMLKMDDFTDRFLRSAIDLAVNHCLQNATAENARAGDAAVYMAVDGLARLVSTIVHGGGGESFLSRFLAILVAVIKRDADERVMGFNARPYLRVLVVLLTELCPADLPETTTLRYLKAIGLALYSAQPISVPGFAFAWLELVSHRLFMPKLLSSPHAQGWALFEVLLVSLLKFLEPYLRTADLADSIRQLYKGTLRLLLVLLHDFPEFLCEHHFTLCDAIPTSCIQMRNLILSAFPRNMRLPDPFTPNLKVDLLPEITQPPRILPESDKLLQEPLKSQVDAFLRTRVPASFPQELAKRLVLGPQEAKTAGTNYNTSLINALVLYIGAATKTATNAMNPAAMDVYLRLATDLDSEGRYLVLNAIANQLRYPNSHTHYFSCVLLTMFAEIKADVVKEQITRVLLERLIVNRPHPWGLLITFIELIKNPRYNFWSHDFTRCAPDIERLFKSVANSCMAPVKPEEDAAGAAPALPKETAVRG